MRKMLIIGSVLISTAAWAAPGNNQNGDNGCFGTDRAAVIRIITGRTWGDIASDRAGTNGDLNRAYVCQ